MSQAVQPQSGIGGKIAAALKGLVEKAGGEMAFLDSLDAGFGQIGEALAEAADRSLLLGMLEDEGLAAEVQAALDEEARRFLASLLPLMRLWMRIRPREYEWVRSTLVDNYALLQGAIPQRVNELRRSSAIVFIDSLTEGYTAKLAVVLGAANKALGGERTFVQSGALSTTLVGIGMMLRSLRLRDSEIEALKLPADRREHGRLAEAIEGIQSALDQVKADLLRLKR